jgi:hypothetical protein
MFLVFLDNDNDRWEGVVFCQRFIDIVYEFGEGGIR